MRLLLDECVDRGLGPEIVGHEVRTVPRMGWAGKRNGELLSLAAAHFDVLVTVDRKLPLNTTSLNAGLQSWFSFQFLTA